MHDDGSSHDFISENLVHKLQLKTSPTSYKVKSAFQGTRYNGTCMVRDLEIQTGAYKGSCNFLIAPHSTDVILDMPFRHQYNLDIDYDNHTMQITKDGTLITLSNDKSLDFFPLISHTQAHRALHKNRKGT